tara:strand:+ start:216 stop:1829 length:1614 start_codon:yes stop_codon:yes gene_type:complete
MSSSIESAFKILQTNNGLPDETLTLRKLLHKRFIELQVNKEEEPITIDDILLTHNLFLTSSYKPFISTSSVYLKNEISQFNLGSYITIDLDNCFRGDFIHDMYLDVRFNAIGDKKNLGKDDELKYRYTPYPGIRMIEKIELYLNGKKTDVYTQEDMLFYINYELSNEKRKAFEECCGHYDSLESTYYSPDREHNEINHVKDNYQTFKCYQEELHMTIPLLFWFNKYLEKSYPILKQDNVIMNNSRNHIKVWFSSLDKIIQVGKYTSDDGIVDESTVNTPYFSTYTISQANNKFNSRIEKPNINMSLYVNNIFVNDEVRNFYIDNIDMYMISTYQSFDVNIGNKTEYKIKDLNDMTPYIYFAFRSKDNEDSFENWYKFTCAKRKWHPIAVYNQTVIDQDEGQYQDTLQTNVFILGLKRSYYDIQYTPIKNFTLYFDTLPFIEHSNPTIYSKYLAQKKDDNYSYSSQNGINILPFCRKFTDKDATGHINFSKIQEIILKWDFQDIALNKDFKIYFSGKKINLLSINDSTISMKWASYLA